MPIRAYFLVVGPALAAFLWWTNWYMQPEPPKVYTTAAAPTAPAAPAVKSAAVTTGTASSQTAAQATPAAEPAPEATDIKLVPTLEDTKLVHVEETKRVHQAAVKPKKRKQIARHKPHDSHGPAYAYGSAAPSNPYGGQYFGGQYFSGSRSSYASQPFFGYGRW